MPTDSSNAPRRSEMEPAAESESSAPLSDDADRAILKKLEVGAIIDGKYRIDEVIGRGAMGVVVGATHMQLHEKVALKFLHVKGQGDHGEFHTRFRREAKVSAKLKNEHITRVLDVGLSDNLPFMVMDHLVGADLRAMLNAKGRLGVAQAVDYIVQVCEGVAEAHAKGIVHRDLKPSNLFVTTRSDGSDLIKILDFGISKWSAEGEVGELTHTGVVLGSPKYMAPDQLFGSSDVDARADVWSIGAILYEMLAGQPPFNQSSLARICAELSSARMPPSITASNPDVSSALEAVIFRCFERERTARIQNVALLAGALLDAVNAPFASEVRVRIAATLDPSAAKDPLASLGHLTTTGAFRASPSSRGSGSTQAGVTSEEAAARRRPGLVLVALVLLLAVIAVVGSIAMKRDDKSTGSASAIATTAPTATTATATDTATPTPSATESATESASAEPPKTRFVPPPIPARTAAAAAATTTAQAPTPPTTAAPPPPPAATQDPPKKRNPLEDRQ